MKIEQDKLAWCIELRYIQIQRRDSVLISRSYCLLGLLLKARFVRLECSYLLQNPFLLLFTHKLWIRTTTVPRTLRISQHFPDYPFCAVDATVAKA